MASTSSFCDLQKASNHDELFMQQSLIFSDTLKDLKNLRKQLCSAADFFEVSYMKQNQKQIVVETLKDYAIKALINTVDHLGSVAFKVNNLLDEKIGEVSETELQFTCLEQPTSRYHSSSLSAEEECCSQFRSVAQATTMESPSLYVREMLSTLQSPQQFSRQGNLSFIRNSNNRKPENERRAASPLHFSLTRLGSLLKRSPSPSNSSANRRYPSEPRRSVSLSTNAEKDRSKEFEQYSSKSKRLFKALLSMRNPRKDSALYKFLDEN
ncbi:protein ABIL2 [Citrus sinensis]|nr:protein ABIL2 [Citrus sinensis]